MWSMGVVSGAKTARNAYLVQEDENSRTKQFFGILNTSPQERGRGAKKPQLFNKKRGEYVVTLGLKKETKQPKTDRRKKHRNSNEKSLTNVGAISAHSKHA